MADDKANPGGPYRDRINLQQHYEVRHWSQSLGVSKDELRAAVKIVGNIAADVREHLKRQQARAN